MDQVSTVLGIVAVSAPALLVAILSVPSLLGRPLGERPTCRLVALAILVGLLASVAVLVLMLARGTRHVPVELGQWVSIPNFHFSLTFLFDRLSVPFVILSFVLCGTIGAFATNYLHREPGFNRFFVLYALFVLGMVVAALAGTIETLFMGWELVGVSSALLVAFFHERHAPVRNGLWIWAVYRMSDAALLIAAVVLHHLSGEGDFSKLMPGPPWPDSVASLTSAQALLVGLLFLVAAAGKSALAPFSGWLPRAMEGPTPSSAVFYGALSVHLGAFLLLRVGPILDRSPLLGAIVVAVGLATAVVAMFAGRAQTDVKSALSFAALTQVGLIVAEIGLGFRYFALAHLIGHASLRTLQFLRASSVLADYRTAENAIGGRLPRLTGPWERLLPAKAQPWLYRFSLERGYLDAWLSDYVARPFLKTMQACDRLERHWTAWLAGGGPRESDARAPIAGILEDLS